MVTSAPPTQRAQLGVDAMSQKLCLFLFFIFLAPFSTWGSRLFLVSISNDQLKVVSPSEYTPHLRVLVENKTSGKLIGKLQTDEGRVIDYVSIEGHKSGTFLIGHLKRREKVFYYSLAPSFQEVELTVGKAPYEIP